MTVADAELRFHVLAVDDSLIDRKLIEMLLKNSSYQVTTVDSGSKALELLGLRDEAAESSSPSSSPDHQEIAVNLIITDYCMPGMTGYDLLRRVKVRFAHGLKFLSRVGAFTNNHGPQPRVKFSSLICLPTLESRGPPR